MYKNNLESEAKIPLTKFWEGYISKMKTRLRLVNLTELSQTIENKQYEITMTRSTRTMKYLVEVKQNGRVVFQSQSESKANVIQQLIEWMEMTGPVVDFPTVEDLERVFDF